VPPIDRAPVPTGQPPVVPVVPAAPAAAAPKPTAGATHTVNGGEHLWSIAAGHVATMIGKSPADLAAADSAPYWLRVVEINLPRLRSGNPNLVHAGEVVELPPM
jgi:Tfp pilus assembly protein FimV